MAQKNYRKNNKVSVEQYTNIILSRVQEVMDSERFKAFLAAPDILHAFRRDVLLQQPYSFHNRLVLALFGATAVAGFKTWMTLGYRVKKGSKGIPIYSPIIVNKQEQEEQEENGEERMLAGFSIRYVFDISQVEEIPGMAYEEQRKRVKSFMERYRHDLCRELEGGEDAMAKELRSWIEQVCGYPVHEQEMRDGSKGMTDGRAIYLKTGMSPAQQSKSLLHELAHCRLGHLGECNLSKNSREIQAEAAAFIASHHLGMDTSAYSFDYLAAWGHEILESKRGVAEFKSVLQVAIEEGQRMADEFSRQLHTQSKQGLTAVEAA